MKIKIERKEIIEKQVVDTNTIENFVESFIKECFSWQQSQDSYTNRNEQLNWKIESIH